MRPIPTVQLKALSDCLALGSLSRPVDPATGRLGSFNYTGSNSAEYDSASINALIRRGVLSEVEYNRNGYPTKVVANPDHVLVRSIHYLGKRVTWARNEYTPQVTGFGFTKDGRLRFIYHAGSYYSAFVSEITGLASDEKI